MEGRQRWVGRACALLAGIALAGCARNAHLELRIEGIRAALMQAEALGAARCAPRELAVAQSQLEFARLERQQGDGPRALAHLDVADENVRAAALLSAPGRCEASSERADAEAPAAATR